MTLHMDPGPMAWMDRAACLGAPAWLFFPHYAGSDLWEDALTICKECPVVAECRAYADEIEGGRGPESVFGVWAGETPQMRIFRRRREKRGLRPVNRNDLKGSWAASHGGADPFTGECGQGHPRTPESTVFHVRVRRHGDALYAERVERVCRVCKAARYRRQSPDTRREDAS